MLQRKPQTEMKLARVASRSGSAEAGQRPLTCSEDIIQLDKTGFGVEPTGTILMSPTGLQPAGSTGSLNRPRGRGWGLGVGGWDLGIGFWG
jgi:hypothetical protein